MSFDADEEILQDFLVEAGEILEVLSEQLVELENKPDDKNLLNAIFRGFHTVKGGAGFLQLDTLVELCHAAESVFDALRNGKRDVDADLMDVVLQVLDTVNAMFAQVNAREYPEAADPALMAALHRLLEEPAATAPPAPPVPAAPAKVEVPAAPPEPVAQAAGPATPEASAGADLSDDEFEKLLGALGDEPTPNDQASAPKATLPEIGSDEITDDEFEALLDELHGKGGGPSAVSAPAAAAKPAAASKGGSDEITDDEFESLLDELHGKGKHGGIPDAGSKAAASDPVAPAPAASTSSVSADGLITDDEFEKLLDDLHGKGKGPTASHEADVVTAPVAASAVAAPAPAPVAASSVAAKRVAPPADEVKVEPASRPVKAPARAASQHDGDDDSGKKGAASKDPNAQETTVRVDTKRLDDIMNMVGELVLVRNRLVRLGLRSADEAMAKAVANLDVVTGDLQTAVMKTRMQPIKKVFGRFPRVVRDLARNLKKEINLELIGEETDLDKNLVEALADPLVHLVRNAVDHGIEMPNVRESAGKVRTGHVVLSAQQEGDHIVLSISDDGGGMDAEVLRRKAVEKGLMDTESAERLSVTECFNLIFHPGFSTKDAISDVSGRGVGMDVVKTKITQLNGQIEVQSEKGVGTRIAIKVPLTLAIMPTLMVMLGQQAFALPLVSVNEIFHMDLRRTNVVDGQEVVVVREKALPLFHLKRWLVPNDYGDSREDGHVVIVTVGNQKMGFVVDQLIGQEEVVIKPLGKMLHGTPGMAGATITGDGRIALILDVPGMLKTYARR
ncbi:Sensor histidine kinase CheA [gamma proteobacterium HdN1]|nr:Sensor histidine kinase CheA [gamma proteobacterium HdN1]